MGTVQYVAVYGDTQCDFEVSRMLPPGLENNYVVKKCRKLFFSKDLRNDYDGKISEKIML